MVQSFFISIARTLSRSRFFSSPLALVVLGSALLMVLEYVTRIRFQTPILISYFFYWIILAGTLGLIAGAAADRLRHEDDRLLVSTFVAGVMLGLLIAIFKVGVHRELWTLFNILAEPMRTGLLGLVIGWLFVMHSRAPGSRRFAL